MAAGHSSLGLPLLLPADYGPRNSHKGYRVLKMDAKVGHPHPRNYRSDFPTQSNPIPPVTIERGRMSIRTLC
jgi:hypothetical protein